MGLLGPNWNFDFRRRFPAPDGVSETRAGRFSLSCRFGGRVINAAARGVRTVRSLNSLGKEKTWLSAR